MAELFIVPKREPGAELNQVDSVPENFEVTGDTATDLEAALRAIVFLFNWICCIGPEGIQECADKVRAFRCGHE